MGSKNFLQKHPMLNYLQRCFRRRKNQGFVEEVMSIGYDPMRLNVVQLGQENQGKMIYIAKTMGCDGFFAELRFLLKLFW